MKQKSQPAHVEKTTLLDMKEAAAYLHVSVRTVRRLVQAGELPYVRYNEGTAPYFFDLAELNQFIENHKTTPK